MLNLKDLLATFFFPLAGFGLRPRVFSGNRNVALATC